MRLIDERDAVERKPMRVAFRCNDKYAAGLVIAGAMLVFSNAVHGQLIQRASATAANVPATAGSSVLSGDGRFVFFARSADFRVTPPTVASGQWYRRELSSGQMELVSVDLGGNVAGWGVNVGTYEDCASSRDGRLVAFSSREEDLAVNDGNLQLSDVFVRDMQAGVTLVVSVDSQGAPANGESYYSAMSADGRHVAYISEASNLVPGDFNQQPDVFVYDRSTLSTARASLATNGLGADYTGIQFPTIFGVSISGDGRFVAFSCNAVNLIPNDTNMRLDVFIHDQLTGATELVAYPPGSTIPPANGVGYFPELSHDGRFVAFLSVAPDLVVPPLAPFLPPQVFFCDRASGQFRLVSSSPADQISSGVCTAPGISVDGRYVTFSTDGSNLLPQDNNDEYDAFVRDMQTNVLVRWSSNANGEAARGFSVIGGISDDGTLLTVDSDATDLVAGHLAFGAGTVVIDRTLSTPPIETYCTPSPNSQGCEPKIAPLGLPTLSGKYAFFVTARSVLNHHKGALAVGLTPAQTPWMGGTLCVRPPVRLVAPADSQGLPGSGSDCTGWFSFRMTPQWMLARGWTAGTTIYCQYFCRDSGFAASNQLALTEGMRFTVLP